MAEGRNQAAVSHEGSDSDKDTLATAGRNNLRQSPLTHKDRQTAAAGRNLRQTAAAIFIKPRPQAAIFVKPRPQASILTIDRR